MSEAPVVSADRPGTRLATRIAFFIAGFLVSCWAPLVPYAQTRLGVDNALLGLLLLCLGAGSVGAMLLTGTLSARYGSRPIILVGCVGLVLDLPLLTLASTPLSLGAALFAFGGFLGSLDVAMNIHAVEVERAAERPLMSGFHGLYSVGGFAGAAVMTLLLSLHFGATRSTLLCSALMIVATLVAWPRFLIQTTPSSGSSSVVPRGIVLLLAALTGITFLAEGAVLDWGALLMTRAGLVSVAHGGIGYALYSIAMTVGRLSGDRLVALAGDRATLFWGSLLAMAGFLLAVSAPIAALALVGFLLIGAGCSNIVPVLFRGAGAQKVMPMGMAVAAISTTGYAGVLVGPAAIGFLAQMTNLRVAFGLLAALISLVAFTSGLVAGRRS
ncbi:MAG TPA: MFS transporter [Steroidobacteraceae bacterium]